MFTSLLMIINIGVIVYGATIFVRLHEDVTLMNEDIENMRNEIKQVIERVELEKIKTQQRLEKGDEFLGI
tara:strand:+ start:81 stop:290 length:210 start_codon:yes stop_codon:yes gene_type:complete